jgi:hypothetical protein
MMKQPDPWAPRNFFFHGPTVSIAEYPSSAELVTAISDAIGETKFTRRELKRHAKAKGGDLSKVREVMSPLAGQAAGKHRRASL